MIAERIETASKQRDRKTESAQRQLQKSESVPVQTHRQDSSGGFGKLLGRLLKFNSSVDPSSRRREVSPRQSVGQGASSTITQQPSSRMLNPNLSKNGAEEVSTSKPASTTLTTTKSLHRSSNSPPTSAAASPASGSPDNGPSSQQPEESKTRRLSGVQRSLQKYISGVKSPNSTVSSRASPASLGSTSPQTGEHCDSEQLQTSTSVPFPAPTRSAGADSAGKSLTSSPSVPIPLPPSAPKSMMVSPKVMQQQQQYDVRDSASERTSAVAAALEVAAAHAASNSAGAAPSVFQTAQREPSPQAGTAAALPSSSSSSASSLPPLTMEKLAPAPRVRRAAPDPSKSRIIGVCSSLPPAMARDKWCIEDYTQLQKIHSGYASSVYKGVCRWSGETVVLKIYKPALLHVISQHQLMRETRLHVQLDHPNIVKLYAAFKQGDGVVLVQEYADGGDLLQVLLKNGSRLSEQSAVRMVIQPLLRALYYLHSKNIVHRDVKLENILFSNGEEMTLKLADFGLCLNLKEERSVTRAGTLDYMAPEVLRCPTKSFPEENKHREDLACSTAVDVWAMGVMTFELLNGCPPFTRPEREDTERAILRAQPPPFLAEVSEAAKEFVFACFAREAAKRPSAWQLMRHPWAGLTAPTQRSSSLQSRASLTALRVPDEVQENSGGSLSTPNTPVKQAAITAPPRAALQPQPPASPSPKDSRDGSGGGSGPALARRNSYQWQQWQPRSAATSAVDAAPTVEELKAGKGRALTKSLSHQPSPPAGSMPLKHQPQQTGAVASQPRASGGGSIPGAASAPYPAAEASRPAGGRRSVGPYTYHGDDEELEASLSSKLSKLPLDPSVTVHVPASSSVVQQAAHTAHGRRLEKSTTAPTNVAAKLQAAKDTSTAPLSSVPSVGSTTAAASASVSTAAAVAAAAGVVLAEPGRSLHKQVSAPFAPLPLTASVPFPGATTSQSNKSLLETVAEALRDMPAPLIHGSAAPHSPRN